MGIVTEGTAEGFRLQIEDVFVVTGRGTIVSGRVLSGVLQSGQPAQIVREGQIVARAHHTAVEMINRMPQAPPTDAVSLLVAGVDRSQVQPGDLVVA